MFILVQNVHGLTYSTYFQRNGALSCVLIIFATGTIRILHRDESDQYLYGAFKHTFMHCIFKDKQMAIPELAFAKVS